MTITSRLRNSSILSASLLILLIPVLLWSYDKIKHPKQNDVLAAKIHAAVFTLSSSRDQYLLYREQRSRDAWTARTALAEGLLRQAELRFEGEGSAALIAGMKQDLKDSSLLFELVVRNFEARKLEGLNERFPGEGEKGLVSQMLLRDEQLQQAALSLESLGMAGIEQEYRNSLFFTILFILLVVVITVVSTAMFNMLLRSRLKAIHSGSEIIAGGDLDYRLDCHQSDELADLARTINSLAEKAQYLGEERFREIFNQAPLGIALSEASTGRIYEANQRFAEIAGRTVEQIVEMNWMELTHPDDLRDDLDCMARLNAGEIKGFAKNKRYLRPDGSVVWVEKTIAPVTSIGRAAASNLCMVADISERRAAEAVVLEKKKFLETIAATTPDVLYLYDASQRKSLYVNKEIGPLLGYSVDDLLAHGGYHRLENVHPDDLPLVGNHMEEMAGTKSNGVHTLECRIKERSGNYLWVNVRERVYQRDENGKPRVLFGIAQDVTARKASELELASSERRFRELLENVHLVAVTLDTEGAITFCNDFLSHLTGWSKQQMLGANWFDLFIPEEIRDSRKEVFNRGIWTGELQSHFESRIVTRDGKLRSIIWDNSVLHKADNSVAGIASLGIDVTEHRSMEDQLRQSQKMEAIGLLAGGVAHDFNNILTVIMGYGNLLKTDGALGEQDKEGVEQILEAAERASQLTGGLLAFSRKQPMHRQQVNFNEIVQNVQKFLVRIIGEDVQCRFHCEAFELPVCVDGSQMEQVLMNLCTNARDAMPNGGVLIIKTELREIDHSFVSANGYGIPGRYAVVTVSDNGVGIDRQDQRRIFEPFFTTKEVGKGTGLGMAIVYGIVQQHEGFINVYSEPGEGTEVRIYLPLADSRQEAQEEVSGQNLIWCGDETVLVAEDEASVRRLFEAVLTKHGYRVILAEDGQDCIDKFKADMQGIDLIVMDIIMPKKNGMETYQEISQLQPGARVLYSSGYTADFIKNRGVLQDEIRILMKPVHPRELLRAVREVLDR